MKIGVSAHPTAALSELLEWVARADTLGFDLVGIGDSPAIWPEVFSVLALAASRTRTARIGPFVTNPVTRHPSVVASASATLQTLSTGRAFLGLGTGDSAVELIGLRPATRAVLEAYATTVRGLLRGTCVPWQGSELELRWWSGPAVPLFVVAEGPRMLELAGRVADGVFIGTGITPDLMRRSLATVDRGAIGAGRNPRDIERWWIVRLVVADSIAEGRQMARGFLATIGNHAFRFGFEDKDVPEVHQRSLRALQQHYDYTRHATSDPTANARLVETYGLVDFLAERYLIAGPPAHCAERLQAMADAGAEGVVLVGGAAAPDTRAYLQVVADTVRPLLAG